MSIISLTVALDSNMKNRNYLRSQPENFCQFFLRKFAEYYILETMKIRTGQFKFVFKDKVILVSKMKLFDIINEFSIKNDMFSWSFQGNVLKNWSILVQKLHAYCSYKINEFLIKNDSFSSKNSDFRRGLLSTLNNRC